MSDRSWLNQGRRWVVKIGSALLTDDGRGLNRHGIAAWVDQLAVLAQAGVEVVLVSSGSVAEGMVRLGMKQRPDTIHDLQAAAAVGQMGLVQAYETNFQRHGLATAQILLTHADLSDRQRYLNARSTLKTLFKYQVIPIINENDTVVTDEIRFGDNDTLAALVANLIEADLLLILTDQSGMYREDPRLNPAAELIHEAMADAPELLAMAGDGGSLGRGGMLTKVRAAKLAARSGTPTLIVGGRLEAVIQRVRGAELLGTLLLPQEEPITARKRWLAGHLQTRGTLVLDAGAVRVLRNSGTSLLPVGVLDVRGNFRRGEMVECIALDGALVARGLVNYSAEEARLIRGRPSQEIQGLLGYQDDDELIHRDNLVLIS